MLTIEVPGAVAERLNAASAKRRWFPFDDHVIDWSIPMTDDWSYMPAEHSALSGAPWFEALAQTDRTFLERWEMTQSMRNIAHGEHLLNQGILAMLWEVDPYDPSYRYLLHEVAEECQHMAMFNQWVRANADIETISNGEETWGGQIGAYTQELAVRLPEAFWVNVLLFEFVGDEFNQAMRGGKCSAASSRRPMHPTLVAIGVVHTAEEARHINYARKWLNQGIPGLSDGDRLELQLLAELGVRGLIDQKSFLPLKWTQQLAPFVDEATFDATLESRSGTIVMLRQLRKLLVEFEALGIVRPATMQAWAAEGVFELD